MKETKNSSSQELETQLQAIFETFKNKWLDFSAEQEEYITSIDTKELVEIFESCHKKALESIESKTTKEKLANVFWKKKSKGTKKQIEEIYNTTQNSLEIYKKMFEWVFINIWIELIQEDIDMNKNAINHTLINWILSFMIILN